MTLNWYKKSDHELLNSLDQFPDLKKQLEEQVKKGSVAGFFSGAWWMSPFGYVCDYNHYRLTWLLYHLKRNQQLGVDRTNLEIENKNE